jgi:hypothetical protein
LYFLAAVMVVAAVMIALFTRETAGRFRDSDRALVSRTSCRVDQLPAQPKEK